METPLFRPPTTFYRVSLKAVIRDENGRILAVQENQADWSCLAAAGITTKPSTKHWHRSWSMDFKNLVAHE